jgi:YD repeat-containing protein
MLQFKNKSFYYFLCLSLFFVTGYSQTQKLPDFAMQTPQAAALSKYSEYPVGSFTGVPSINVPLYTIECGDISFPIGLNYHAGGFKVTEEASWVGLGWTLTANGAITRTVNGSDDFIGGFGIKEPYHRAKKIVDITNGCGPNYDTFPIDTIVFGLPTGICVGDNKFSPPNEKSPSYSIYRSRFATVNGKIENYDDYNDFDWEPDVYSINIMGLNGKFVLDQDKNIYFLDQQDIEIKRTASGGWMARSNDGFQYFFEKKETTRSWDGTSELNGSWHVTKIVSPTKREMNFIYDQDIQPTWQTSYSESTYDWYQYNETKTVNVFLKKIEFDTGYVIFNRDTNLREDIKEAQRLKTIQIYNKSNTLIKEFEFATSYFNTNDNTRGFTKGMNASNGITDVDFSYYQKRLKLDKIIERNGALLKNTQFNYSTINLPNKDSFSQDHWGYYNGKLNSSLIPAVETIFPFERIYEQTNVTPTTCVPRTVVERYNFYNIGGRSANRDSNSATMGANILKEIVYPTGGKTSFEFEANDCIPYGRDAEQYVDFIQSIKRESRPEVTDLTSATNGLTPTTTGSKSSVSFTFPPNFGVYASAVKFEIVGSTPLTVNDRMSATIEGPNFNQYIGFTDLLKSNNSFLQLVPIQAGSVKLSIDIPELNNYQTAKLTFSCKLKNYNYSKKYVGGLRVKKITHIDGVNVQNNIVKKYSYLRDFINNSNAITTSGILKAPLKYWTKYDGDPSTNCQSKIDFSSSIKNGLTMSQYSHIGYGEVTESIGENGELGGTQYIYYNLPNVSFSEDHDGYLETIVPPGVPYTVNQGFDGRLKSKILFDVAKKTQQYEYYEYQKLSEKIVKSIVQKPYSNQINNNNIITILYGYGGVFWYYPIFSRWEPMVGSKKGIYNKSSNSYTETTTAYEFNTENLLPSKTTTKDSNDNSIITKNQYPTDVTNANYTTVLGEPLSATEYNTVNQLKRNKDNAGGIGDFKTAQPIQVEAYKNSDLLSRQRTIFNTFGNLTLPSALKTSKASNPLETRIAYNKYDDKGNPLELQLPGGTMVVYIWGYNKTLPLAKIENAMYASIPVATITNLQALSDIDNDRCSAIPCSGNEENLRVALNLLRASLPNAMVTTFTHDPLIGVTSITDPKGDKVTYEYDGFNRLKWILDKNGNKLSENEYHFKNP